MTCLCDETMLAALRHSCWVLPLASNLCIRPGCACEQIDGRKSVCKATCIHYHMSLCNHPLHWHCCCMKAVIQSCMRCSFLAQKHICETLQMFSCLPDQGIHLLPSEICNFAQNYLAHRLIGDLLRKCVLQAAPTE